MSKSYLERTVAVFKEHNFSTWKVENFNAYGGVRIDLFGIIDVLAIHPHHGTVGLQICGADWSPHLKKLTIDRHEALILWLLAGNRFLLVGWRELKGVMTPRWREFTLADFPEITGAVQTKLSKAPSEAFPWLSPKDP